MTKTQKILAGGILLIAVGVGGYFAYKLYQDNKNKQKDNKKDGNKKLSNTDNNSQNKEDEIDMGQKVELGDVEDTPKTEDVVNIPRMTKEATKNYIKGKYQNEKFPIGYLMKGAKVKAIQSYLNKKYNAGLKVDGYFGEKTLAALKKYMNLESVDEKTYSKMIS